MVAYPQLKREGPDYAVSWAETTMRFSKLHDAKDGYSANLRVVLSSLPNSGIIYNSRIQLSGSVSKKTAAKACTDRTEDAQDWDWLSRIETACRMVEEAIEEGEPIIDLAEVINAEEEQPWAIEPFCRLGDTTLLFGMGGTGKSTVGALAAVSMMAHYENIFVTALPLKTLVLDWEDNGDNWAHRIDLLCCGLGVEKPHILYKQADASLQTMADALSRQIAQEGIEYLIIDSAVLACGGEPEKAEPTAAFFRALRLLHLPGGSLIIGHHGKSEGAEKYPYGNIFWWNSPRRVWYAKGSTERTGNSIDVGLWNQKANNGPLETPISLHIDYLHTGTFVTKRDVANVSDFRSQLHVRDRIYAIAKETNQTLHRGIPREEIYEELNSDPKAQVPRNTFNVTLKRMTDRSELIAVSDLLWLPSLIPSDKPS